MVDLLSKRNQGTTAEKKGRELNAPRTEGTAKRPCRRMRQAAPDWALAQRGPYT